MNPKIAFLLRKGATDNRACYGLEQRSEFALIDGQMVWSRQAAMWGSASCHDRVEVDCGLWKWMGCWLSYYCYVF